MTSLLCLSCIICTGAISLIFCFYLRTFALYPAFNVITSLCFHLAFGPHSTFHDLLQSRMVHLKCLKIWATSWEIMFMPYANNKGANQPAHPRDLISAFVVRCLDSLILLLAIAEISRLLTSLCSWAGRFESYLVANPETGFLVTRLNSSNKPCKNTNAKQTTFNKHARVFTPHHWLKSP